MNASSSIVLIGNVGGVVASDMHHSPDPIFPNVVSDDCLAHAPTVFLWRMFPYYVVLWDIFNLTTRTLSFPNKALITSGLLLVGMFPKQGPVIDLLSCKQLEGFGWVIHSSSSYHA